MSSIRQPIRLQVLAHLPTDFFHCSHCERLFEQAGIGAALHQEMRSDYPVETLDEALRLSAWLQDLADRYGERLHIRVIDPQSPEGFVQSLRHRVRRYPTFIVNQKLTYTGWEPGALERLLLESAGEASASVDEEMSS